MPKYWGKQICTHGRFPEVGQKQKTERERRGGERERLNDCNNNGQATHGARKPPGPICPNVLAERFYRNSIVRGKSCRQLFVLGAGKVILLE